jgi:hypothetical protein
MPNVLDLQRETRKAVAANPTQVNPGNSYFYSLTAYYHEDRGLAGKPCCVVGHGLAGVGFKYADISALNYARPSYVINNRDELIDYDESWEQRKAVQWLDAIQKYQDIHSCTWAQALILADREVYNWDSETDNAIHTAEEI